MLEAKLPSSLVYRLLTSLLNKRSFSMLFTLRELPFITHSQIFEDIYAYSMIASSHKWSFIAISIGQIDYFACFYSP
jgi:hypothetical protein